MVLSLDIFDSRGFDLSLPARFQFLPSAVLGLSYTTQLKKLLLKFLQMRQVRNASCGNQLEQTNRWSIHDGGEIQNVHYSNGPSCEVFLICELILLLGAIGVVLTEWQYVSSDTTGHFVLTGRPSLARF